MSLATEAGVIQQSQQNSLTGFLAPGNTEAANEMWIPAISLD